MKRHFFTIQTKLLAGFLGILIFAGFAGITGIRGISSINRQNEIGVIVDKLSGSVEIAQAASLRYIIYEEEQYYDLAMDASLETLNRAQQLQQTVREERNLRNTIELIEKVEEYRGLIRDYRENDIELQVLQERRKETGLAVIRMTEELISSIGMDAQSAASYANRSGAETLVYELQRLLSDLNQFRTTALNYSLEKTVDGRNRAAGEWSRALDANYKGYESLDVSTLDKEKVFLLENIRGELLNYIRNVEDYHESVKGLWSLQYEQRESAGMVTTQVENVRQRVQKDIAETTAMARTSILVSLCIAVLFSFLIAVLLSRNITLPLIEGIQVARNIAEGKLDNGALNLARQDELGELGASLDTMTHSLQVQHWAERGKQELDDALRGDPEFKFLAEKFIGFMTPHFQACMGAFYVFDGKETLELLTSYGFSDRQGNFNCIKLGEGFVGQGAKERKTLYFSRLQEAPRYNYGAGEEQPEHFMVCPLIFKDELIAVFLIGSFREFDEDQRKFITDNMGNVAVLFNSAKSRETISRLLLSAQQQQEELRQTNEELEKQSNALRESEAELQAQQEELRVTNEELEEQTQALEQQRDSVRLKNEELTRAREEVEKKADDLEQASRYKSDFLANMSHELRTPLNSILILAKLFAENGEGNLNEKQLKSAEAIHSSGSDLLNLINEILDLSKVEAGKIELNIDAVSFSSVLDDLNRVFADSARQKGLELTFSKDDELPDIIKTDGHRLQQILRNLLTNAIKFTDSGSVSLEILKPGGPWKGLNADGYLKMEVRDTGIGIPEEKQASIFEAFKQADGSTMRKYGGTGLGLSISRELSTLLGGSLTLESEKGKGSCFTLTLPLEVPEERASREPAPEEGGQRVRNNTESSPRETDIHKQTDRVRESSVVFEDSDVSDDRKDIGKGDKVILIIEDDPNFVNVLAGLVRDKGYKTLIAEDGETGLHFADYYRPDAIILDIGLPGIDGWTVMERLKGNSDLRHIPVHFMSGQDDDLQAMKMGAVGYLTKPVSMEDIDAALEKIDNLTGRHVSSLLIVEDDDIQRQSIRDLIGDEDVDITDVATGKEAFDALQSSYLDCMILDLGLRDMSGFELLGKINGDKNCLRIPIIIYTGRDLSVEESAELSRYSNSIIIKGVKSPERLLDETTLFLHRVESNLPDEKRSMLKKIHTGETILEGKNVLLVDDDMRNVFALSSVLEEKNISVVIARDGVEALEKIESETAVDLVLMDIMMPRMDGYEAMRQIRRKHQYKNLPIIALTAKAMKGDRNRCIEAGASDYLAKPVDMEKLLSMLRVWLYS